MTTREVAAGNFVYLPLDESGNPLPFNSPKNTVVAGYFLAAFDLPDKQGEDVWTPTGDVMLPVKLTPDGIPDGVILFLTGGK